VRLHGKPLFRSLEGDYRTLAPFSFDPGPRDGQFCPTPTMMLPMLAFNQMMILLISVSQVASIICVSHCAGPRLVIFLKPSLYRKTMDPTFQPMTSRHSFLLSLSFLQYKDLNSEPHTC
jgi:hypothetical protein